MMQKTWPHAVLNADLPSVSLTLYRYSSLVRSILRSSAVYISEENSYSCRSDSTSPSQPAVGRLATSIKITKLPIKSTDRGHSSARDGNQSTCYGHFPVTTVHFSYFTTLL